MNGVKVNLGNSLFNKDLKIEKLSADLFHLEERLRQAESGKLELVDKNKNLEKSVADLQAKVRIQDLELAQLQMKLTSAATLNEKQSSVSSQLKQAEEGNLGRIEALLRENSYLKEKIVETESDRDRLLVDLKLLTARLDKSQKLAAELQEGMAKKQADIVLLEKTLARKNEHLDVLVKRDKEMTQGHKLKRQEIVQERLLEATETEKVLESRPEREWRETAQTAQTQLEALKRKLKRLEEEKAGLEKENKKVKDDNFYLVNRLKTLK